MCGIAGIAGKNAIAYKDAVERMIASMRHRGPDGSGIYVSPSGTCVLGHTRLSILDLTDAASQPMLSPDTNYALVYNGECYNYHELRNKLKTSNMAFKSSGDTEVILNLLIKHQANKLSELNAMFALAFWDERKQLLLLARDRFGQKPLYYAQLGKLILFASEVRTLLASGLIERKINHTSVHSYLAYGSVQEPDTIVSGVSALFPGSFMEYPQDCHAATKKYWSFNKVEKSLSDDELRDSFCGATERHLISDAPLGIFLSGGIDSSAIVLAAAHKSSVRHKALTVVFPEHSDLSEAKYAKKVARLAGTEHHEIPVTGVQMRKIIYEAIDAMDQPTGDAINTYIVSHAAKQCGLKAVLSGLGGDELFGGYHLFKDIPKMVKARKLISMLKWTSPFLHGKQSTFSVKAAKLAELFDTPQNILNYYLIRRRNFSWRQIRAFAPELTGSHWESGLDENTTRQLFNITQDCEIHDVIGRLEMQMYMRQTLLRDSDVMGMANNVEIRLPFLDSEFSTNSMNLESKARIPSPYSKWRFVKAMGDLMPSSIATRPKQCFTLPFESWMQNDLRDDIQEGIILLADLCDFTKPKELNRLWSQFLANPKKIGWFRPWTLFVLGRYLQKNQLRI